MTYDVAPSEPERIRAEFAVPLHLAGGPAAASDPLLIDCDTCSVRGIGCGDCVITVLLGGPPAGVTLNDEERRAVEVLAAAGLVPPLRLVQSVETVAIDPP
jgi:hypothetical protein